MPTVQIIPRRILKMARLCRLCKSEQNVYLFHSESSTSQPKMKNIIILKLRDDVGHDSNLLLSLWYLDGSCFVRRQKSVALLLDKLFSICPCYRLFINLSKCEVFWPTGDPAFLEFPATVQRVITTSGGSQLLGSPIFLDCKNV